MNQLSLSGLLTISRLLKLIVVPTRYFVVFHQHEEITSQRKDIQPAWSLLIEGTLLQEDRRDVIWIMLELIS